MLCFHVREKLIERPRLAAPEIILYKDQWFIAALLPSLKGIQVSHLTWEKLEQAAARK